MGKANNLASRVSSYFSSDLLPKTAALVADIAKIDHIVVESEVDALLLEANYIRKLMPKYNIIGKDDKSSPYIEIPSLKIVHQKKKNFKYFGPYPPGSDIRGLLRFLRKQLDVYPFLEPSVYKVNLRRLTAFLAGRRKSVQKELEREMREYAKLQNFEKASEIKHKLEQIEYITSGKFQPWQYEQNPNLVSDRLNLETNELKKILKLDVLEKIEAYDISNTSGKQATGARVVFINGQPAKNLYRHYKIKLKNTPDDFAMMSEMISRRLKSTDPLPDLMIIDGGLEHLGFKRPPLLKVIGIAKKLETIVLEDGTKINLPDNSPSLHLVQRLRDEAHRFSRRYHFFLRSKKMLE